MNRDWDADKEYEHDREPRSPSQLFLLRVWRPEKPETDDWQGMLQQTVTGESHYFKSCEELRRLLSEITSPPRAGLSGDAPRSEMD